MLLCCIAENHGILFLTFLIARVVRVGWMLVAQSVAMISW
jgi:hypothetical protein